MIVETEIVENNVEKLVVENDGLVWFLVKSFPLHEREEWHSIGVIGMIKAARSFDPGKGFKFTTYATRIIQNEIRMELRKRRKRPPVSISLDADIADEGAAQFRDIIADTTVNIEQNYADYDEQHQVMAVLHEVIAGWSERDRTILLMYGEGKKRWEIGNVIGVSQTYVSRLIPKLLNRARIAIEARQIELASKRRTEAKERELANSAVDSPSQEGRDNQMKVTLTREEYLQKRAAGMTRREVIAEQKITEATLYYWLNKWGINRETEREEIQRLVALQASNTTGHTTTSVSEDKPLVTPVTQLNTAPASDVHAAITRNSAYVTIRVPLSKVELPDEIHTRELSRSGLLDAAIRLAQEAVVRAFDDLADLTGAEVSVEQVQAYVDRRCGVSAASTFHNPLLVKGA